MSGGSQHSTLCWRAGGAGGGGGSQFNTMLGDSASFHDSCTRYHGEKGWFTIQHYVGISGAISKKHDQQVPKNQCRLTHYLINFELTHVPTMILFPLLVGEVLKNTIFFSFLSMIPARDHWEKRKLNIRQGYT